MSYRQSKIERFWNGFALVVCLAAAVDVMYWHRTMWEASLAPLLWIVAGNLLARFTGRFPHSGLNNRD